MGLEQVRQLVGGPEQVIDLVIFPKKKRNYIPKKRSGVAMIPRVIDTKKHGYLARFLAGFFAGFGSGGVDSIRRSTSSALGSFSSFFSLVMVGV
jgi:hypothetical protein